MNAFEAGDEVVMIGYRYVVPRDAQGRMDAPRMAKQIAHLQMEARLHRWRFNLKTGATREETIDPDRNVEFPAWNNWLTGRRTRYSYSMAQTFERPHFTGIVKHNTDSGAAETWSEGPGNWYSEAPFAPKDYATGEDDGYVVSFVWNDPAQRTELQVFDAKDLSRGPVARVIVPQKVPAGFHATWMQAKHIRA